MATLYVTEYAGLGGGADGSVQAAAGPPLAEQTVAIAAGAASSAAFNAATTLIRLHTDAICSVKPGGVAPVATAASGRMVAGQTEYFRVAGGDKVSVIVNT